MENNEVMNYEETETMDIEDMAEKGTGVGTGVAMLIGAGLAIAVGAGVKLCKKAYAAYKAKRELRKPDREIMVDESDIEYVAEK